MQELRFTVSPDKRVRAITYGVSALFIGTLALTGGSIYAGEGFSRGFGITLSIMAVTYGVIVLFAWLYSPKDYVLGWQRIVIERHAGNIEIPYRSIRKIEKIESLGSGVIRTWGNGGLFSFSGRFRSKELGNFRIYAKNKNYVLIDADERYVISPDERDEFLLMLRGRLP